MMKKVLSAALALYLVIALLPAFVFADTTPTDPGNQSTDTSSTGSPSTDNPSTDNPSTESPSGEPTESPSGEPTESPSGEPTESPSPDPTQPGGSSGAEAPEGHCQCDDSTCASPSHRGDQLGEYGGNICINIPEDGGTLCAACKAYAESLKGGNTSTDDDKDPEPSQSTAPTVPTVDPSTPQKAEDFNDVDVGMWYNDDLTTMLQKGWFIGQTGGAFAPQSATTGAEVVVILSRVLGEDLVTTGSAWAVEAMLWADQQGLTEGITITTSGELARQDLILMLWRAAGKPASTQALTFSDVDSVSGDALTALRWAVEKGIVQGNPDGTVNPDGGTKRCEMCALMVRYDAAVNG